MAEVEYLPKGAKRLLEPETATIFVKSRGTESYQSTIKGRKIYRLLKASVPSAIENLKKLGVTKIRIIGYNEAIDHVTPLQAAIDHAINRAQRSE